jgi:hypothetical protein
MFLTMIGLSGPLDHRLIRELIAARDFLVRDFLVLDKRRDQVYNQSVRKRFCFVSSINPVENDSEKGGITKHHFDAALAFLEQASV